MMIVEFLDGASIDDPKEGYDCEGTLYVIMHMFRLHMSHHSISIEV